ncbi:MAG: hypothetical protein CL917_07095 [Deltaproteobacteria bacterium]|nr:hypothetical protein [Deltaproteobacteria bacterium]
MTNPVRLVKAAAASKKESLESSSDEFLTAEAEFHEALLGMSPEELSGIDIDEFREFMMGGEEHVPTSPQFKEGLRRELWWMMVSRLVRRGRAQTPE